jgi:flagellar hook protein FlgE
MKGGSSMMFSINSSLSALRAYGKRMGVHANNVVNLHSTGFVKSRVVAKEGPGQTVTAEIDRVDAHMLERGKTGENSPVDVDPGAANTARDDVLTNSNDNNVDLATELVGTTITQGGYRSNLKMVQAQEEMVGTLIDMLN